MRKYTSLLFILLVVALTLVSTVEVNSSSATTYTYAIDKKGNFVVTQDAYLPDRTILDLGLDSPEDIFIDQDDNVFIADTRNRRIVVYDPSTNTVLYEITHDEFSSPRGIFITEDNELYVADSIAEAVFRFTIDGTLIAKYTKPTSPSFEASSFNPKKIAVDNQNNMFIIAEGVFDGIIQLSDSGEFLGYFATNKVILSPRQMLENAIFSEEQMEQTGDRNPISFSNVFVDENGLKYSTSLGEGIENLKKHNTDGTSNIESGFRFDLELVDVYTDNYGIIYTASHTGFISIFTSDGAFIFTFGANTDDEDVAGLYSELSSIAVDSTGRIWTLDSEKAFLQSYTATDYSQTIYSALTLYKNGKYADAVDEWEEVLKLNQLSVLAHNEIGRNLYSQGEYEESMGHFILSGNRELYSQSFWEVRNVSLQQKLPVFILGLMLFTVLYYTVKYTNRKYQYLASPAGKIKKVGEIKIINDVLYMFNLIKHPLDSFYYIKKKEKGSYKGATIIFGMFFVAYLINTTSKSFIYQLVEAADMDLNAIVLGFFAIAALFIVSNYLVTSINDGEGSLGEIYKGVMYSLLPLMVAYLVTTFLSYYFTYNELFMLQLVLMIGMGWTTLLIFLAVQELHNYTISNTIKSLLLTFLFMIIFAILFAFVQIMGDQLIQFVIGLVKEAVRNVFS
jgi:tetratricopeptide (TPR) repeat protein